jgi:hypothetical protein
MEGCARQLYFLKSLLPTYADSTRLKVNYSKSMMVPMNIEEDRLQMLARTFGCSVGSLLFTYPGLPLGLTKPKIVDFLPLVSRCEKRLIATSNFVSQDGRLQMTNIFLCTFKLEDTGI